MPDAFPRTYDFKRIEADVSKLWKDKNIVEKSITLDAKKPLFSFLEGPPTANAPPGLHHVQSRLYKDLTCRYKLMRGFSVPRKGGWDCHGLPVEVQVEKKLGLKSKKDVLNYGIGKFNALCRSDIFTFIGSWNTLTERMAYWIDLKNPYVTMDNGYIESVWWSLQELHKKGLLYEDFKVVPYCPRCETPLSSHEVALGYNDVTEPAITVMFQLKDNPERYFLAWTTTPWTLPSNIALAVHPDVTYAIVEDNNYKGRQFILAKDLVEKHFANPVIVEEILGSDLEGKNYVPVFDYFMGKVEKRGWFVTSADFVTTKDGTGIVHQTYAFGEDDFNNCKKHDLPFFNPVGENGRFTGEVEDFAGLFVKEADPLIIERMEKDGALFRKEDYTHSYPFCWRCSTPLIYYALRSWFVAVTRHKDRLIELNKKIQWFPDSIKHGRFGDWLANVKDWALSRNKFWGTPLPIWRCDSKDCGNKVAVGGIKELKEKSVKQLKDDEIDLHKPYIDTVKLKCDKCKGEMSRVPYVIDCWYDSGAAAFAQYHYPHAKGSDEAFSVSFPYDFITESIDQTRGWFYTLHVLGALLFDSVAYKSVVVGGLLVDENGEKMSKSKGNIIEPMAFFDRVGVDAVRLYLCSYSHDSSKRIGLELVNSAITQFLMVLWNSCYFASEVLAKKPAVKDAPLKMEDKWIISRVNSLVASVTKAMDSHEHHVVIQALKSFVMDDFSRWYIRLIRDRAAMPDDALHYSLRYVISLVVRLMAPIAPYVSEELYQLLAKEGADSVHLAGWPRPEAVDSELESQMAIGREIVEAILSARDQIQRGLRWPVKRAWVVTKDDAVKVAVRSLPEIIKGQANAKELTLSEEFKDAKLRLKADFSKLEPVFGSITPKIIANLAMHGASAVMSHIENEGSFRLDVDGQMVSITKDHLISELELPANYVMAKSPRADVYVDTEITPEMEVEGYARELIRHIQQARKDMGLTKEQPVAISIVLPDELRQIEDELDENLAEMKSKVGAFKLAFATSRPEHGQFDNESVAMIKGQNIEIFVTLAK